MRLNIWRESRLKPMNYRKSCAIRCAYYDIQEMKQRNTSERETKMLCRHLVAKSAK